MKKKILIGLAVILVAIQFFRPEKNNSGDDTQSITTVYPTPDNVQTILKTSCYDCHSNKTAYPWYNNIQPVAWWLHHHIDEGKGELNFSAFASYAPRRQYRKFTEIKEQLEEGEMPLTSYTLIHRNAILSEEQKSTVIKWSESLQDSLEAHYPMDSLVRKRQ